MDRSISSPVGIGVRGLALIIDLLFNVGVVIGGIFIFSQLNRPLANTVSLIFILIFSILSNLLLPLFWNGYTVGKRAMGIRIATLSGEELTFTQLFLREIVVGHFLYGVGIGIFQLISVYLVATREDKRAIHDLVAGTYVTSDYPE